jgi:hypothetical protein
VEVRKEMGKRRGMRGTREEGRGEREGERGRRMSKERGMGKMICGRGDGEWEWRDERWEGKWGREGACRKVSNNLSP